MRVGIDGKRMPDSKQRGPLGTLEHAHALGLEGVFFRRVLDMSPSLDADELRAIRTRADELGLYLEAGLGMVNPYANAEMPDLRRIGAGDIVRGFERMMAASAEIGCTELWAVTGGFQPYRGRYIYDRFRTDVRWADQLEATQRFLARLAPTARAHGVHINLETHEEITTFELLRLIEAVGTDVMGLVFDTSNGLQRGEHPVWAARRIAPHVRQTHIKDAELRFDAAGVLCRSTVTGTGVVDYGAILPLLQQANPALNLSIECTRSPGASGGPGDILIEIYDPDWHESHPDLSKAELAAYFELVAASMRGGTERGPDSTAGTCTYDDVVADIQAAATHLRGIAGSQSRH